MAYGLHPGNKFKPQIFEDKVNRQRLAEDVFSSLFYVLVDGIWKCM